MKYIGLVDCNNFFVSCERLFQPDLNKKPVVVLSSNDGCVVARSQEIKDIGITTGTPLFQFKDMVSLKSIKVFSSNHKLYRDISTRVLYCIKQNFDEVEQYSIDEAFFYIDSDKCDIGKKISDLKRQVEKEVGIPVSVGVGNTKTIAKYATKLAKRTNGLSFLTVDDWLQLRAEIKLSDLWGVGMARAGEFSSLNLKTVGDFLQLSSYLVKERFGLEGERLRLELEGVVANHLVLTSTTAKSMMSTASFGEEITDKNLLLEAIFGHLRSLFNDLHKTGLQTKKIKLLLYPSRYGSYAFYGASPEVTLDQPVNEILELNKIIIDLFNKTFVLQVPYKKVGVVFSDLVPDQYIQKSLFAESLKEKRDVSELLLHINKRLGRNTLRLGAFTSSLRQKEVLPRSSLRSKAYTTSWSELKTVKARN